MHVGKRLLNFLRSRGLMLIMMMMMRRVIV